MEDINPHHENFLTLKGKFLAKKKDLKEIQDFVDELHDIYKTSSNKKQKYILHILSKLHLYLNELQQDENFDFRKIAESFFEKYDTNTSSETIASYLLFKASFEIGQNKDIQEGIKIAKRALESKWRTGHLKSIARILCIDKNNISILREAINSSGGDLYPPTVADLNADIYVTEGEFEKALEIIDEQRANSHLSLAEFLLSKSYMLLRIGRNSEVIKLIDSKIDSVKGISEKDILIINREVAKKSIRA
ncbi:hypothetical protein [Arsenophonus endosymbiont of Crataerina pallida]|uniref:hypothetical protein n=1 Tax=Arsenophonus endosymbiont of Crataerina pallida TaxID=3066235 RepID=UPI0030CEFD20